MILKGRNVIGTAQHGDTFLSLWHGEGILRHLPRIANAQNEISPADTNLIVDRISKVR
jgi:hypothetical protein